MKKFNVIVGLAIIMLLGFAASSLAGEASVFNTEENWIIRACSEPIINSSPQQYTVWFEVIDGSKIDLSVSKTWKIIPDENVVPKASIVGLADSAYPYPVADATHPATNPDVSITFDSATYTAYVFYTDQDGLKVMAFPNIMRARPIIGVSAAALSFGSVAKDNTSAGQVVTVSNPGTANMNLGTIGVSSGFITGGTCIAGTTRLIPTSAPAGTEGIKTCTITVSFNPTAGGPYSGQLLISSTDQTVQPASVALSGTGTVPTINVSPRTLSFGNVDKNKTLTQNITVSNTGTATLNLGTIEVTGSGYKRNGGTCTGSTQLAPATGSCTITVDFTPLAAQAYSGTVSIASNDQTASVPLSGTGLETNSVDLVITSMTTQSTLYNGRYFPATVTIANKGTTQSGPFTVKAWFSIDNIPNNGGYPADALLFTWSVAGLSGGESQTMTFNNCYFVWFPIHTTYSIAAIIDTENQVVETNKNNNTFVISNIDVPR